MTDIIHPQISKENARKMLAKPPGVFKKQRDIEKIELFHLPSYIVDVDVLTKDERTTQALCIDAVQGSFAFLQSSIFEETPPDEIKTCPFFLDKKIIKEKAIDEYRRHLLHLGLKMRFKFSIEKVEVKQAVYYPFWLGYFRRKGKIDFEVIDAVGGEHQGSLMRSVFMKALLNEEKKAG